MCVACCYFLFRPLVLQSMSSSARQESDSRLSEAISKCLNMKPDIPKTDFYEGVRKKLSDTSSSNRKNLRSSTSRVADRPKIEETMREFSSDLNSLASRFDSFSHCILDLMD